MTGCGQRQQWLTTVLLRVEVGLASRFPSSLGSRSGVLKHPGQQNKLGNVREQVLSLPETQPSYDALQWMGVGR
jgi:hypothetical protein